MENNQRNPKRRLNSLILLVAFTAVMLIVSTYAWFSAQRNVSISSITGTVNVAEGLQISLDAKSWSGSLDLSTLSIMDNAYSNIDIGTGGTANVISHTNYEPTELLPVSTTGTQTNVVELPFYRGTNTEAIKLDDIKQVAYKYTPAGGSETDTTAAANPDIYPGYIAFDVFLQNSGIQSGDTQAVPGAANLSSATKEVLQLNTDSVANVKDGGNANVGLQNTLRVAFAQFSGFAPVTADQKTILQNTNASTSKITDVAIWEPNSKAHVENIVNNNNFIVWESNTVAGEYVADTTNFKFVDGEYVPTHALTDDANGESIANIYDWKTTPTNADDAGKLAQQYTVATLGTTTNVMDLKSAADGETNFEIYKNTVVKLRVYVWLEGQDVDCTNYASHGGGIDIDIGLIKSVTEDVGNRS